MEFQNLVETRRSVRTFRKNISISQGEVQEIIKCAQEAPSWKNSQTARYYVIIDQDRVDEIQRKALPEFNRNSSKNAAALIVTAFEADRSGLNATEIRQMSLEMSGEHMIWDFLICYYA